MNLASALFKRILEEEDFDTWSSLRRHYLPNEYSIIYDLIDKHVALYHGLPTLDDLKLSIRDSVTLDKIYAIEAINVEAEPFLLLDYLKNEFAQKETLNSIYKFVENSVAFETAEETVQSLYEIIAKVEDKVELNLTTESMQKINLFESEEEIDSYIRLGLNTEFDDKIRFKNDDYILIGGKRGAGKSIVCANLAVNAYNQDKSVVWFTIEMNARENLQRACSIATQIPHTKIKYRNLDNQEWMEIVKWWAHRFENSERYIDFYKENRDFDEFHSLLIKEQLRPVQLDIVYDASLTLPKLRAEAVKKCKQLDNVGLIIVDYINQVKRFGSGVEDLYDWKEQINVSKALKSLAQELNVPVVSPYQIDKDGEARFSKGILDSADAAFVLTPGPNSISFKTTKIRGDGDIHFTSKVNWSTVTIGPENGEEIQVEDKRKKRTSFSPDDQSKVMEGIYDS